MLHYKDISRYFNTENKQEFHLKKFVSDTCIFEKKRRKTCMFASIFVSILLKIKENRNNECTLNKWKRRIDKRKINLNECVPVDWQYLMHHYYHYYIYRTVQPFFICHFPSRFLKWKGSLYATMWLQCNNWMLTWLRNFIGSAHFSAYQLYLSFIKTRLLFKENSKSIILIFNVTILMNQLFNLMV